MRYYKYIFTYYDSHRNYNAHCTLEHKTKRFDPDSNNCRSYVLSVLRIRSAIQFYRLFLYSPFTTNILLQASKDLSHLMQTCLNIYAHIHRKVSIGVENNEWIDITPKLYRYENDDSDNEFSDDEFHTVTLDIDIKNIVGYYDVASPSLCYICNNTGEIVRHLLIKPV